MDKEQKIFVTQVSNDKANLMREQLVVKGFSIRTPPYTHFSAKGEGVICTFYTSGKLCVQGKGLKEFVEYYLEPEILEKFTFSHPEEEENDNYQSHIGIDESGKGDFFGPLCIAGVFAEKTEIIKLKQIGVKDSKLLNDNAIEKLAKEIRKNFRHHLVIINPEKYNEIYPKFGNLNSMLAWGHATAIEHLVKSTNCNEVIIDQFASEYVVLNALKRKKIIINLMQRHRAESDLVVAAASILARAAFLNGLKQLSSTYGQTFSKGASKHTIEAGKLFVSNHGREELNKVCKLHFKTLDSI